MPHKETPLHDSIIHCNGENMSQETIKMINVMAEKAFNMKETKESQKEIFLRVHGEVYAQTPIYSSYSQIDMYVLVLEAYRIERNKQEAPDESKIQEYIDSAPYYGSCTTEYKEGIEDGIKWAINHFTNLNK